MKSAAIRVEQLFLSISPVAKLNYKKSYGLSSLILFFFTFSFIGWVWEVSLHLIGDGMFINRGVLMGPWLPIYGTGGVLILVLLQKWRNRPLILAGMIMLLCGVIEFMTSLCLESLFGVRWWNYSDMAFQIQGRVCLEGLLIFAIGGLFIVYLAAPKLDAFYSRLSRRSTCLLCSVLTLIFLWDAIHSFLSPNMGAGITY